MDLLVQGLHDQPVAVDRQDQISFGKLLLELLPCQMLYRVGSETRSGIAAVKFLDAQDIRRA